MATAIEAGPESSKELETWLTRNQVSDLLKISVGTIMEWERDGKLDGRKRPRTGHGPKDEIVYDPRQVVKLSTVRPRTKHRSAGEIAAYAFAAFDRGEGMRDIVVGLQRTPAEAKAVYQDWLELGGSARVVTDAHRALLVALVGDFDTVSELVELVERKLQTRA